MKRLLLLPLLFVFAVISAAAASLSPSDRDIYETAVNLQNYPNASVAVLLDKTKMNISHDRSYVKTRRVVKRILNYKGKKEHAEFKIVFDDRYEEVTVDFAVTVNGGDGGYKVTPVEDSAVKIIDAPFDTGNMHYAVHKMMIVAFPAVEEGSVVDIVYTIKNNMKKDFSYKTVFADPEAVCKKIFTVIYPSDMFLNAGLLRHKGDVDERRAADSILVNGRKSITWSAVELPQALRESNAPYRSYLFTSGYISTYRDWDSFRAELAAMFYEKAVASEELKQITETVIAGAGDDRDRIVRVRDYIARNVAVKNIDGLTSYELRTPESIQKSGYAGSFDRTLLMCVMLDLAGLKAEPVIVGPSELFWKDYEDRVYTDSFYHVLTRTGCDGEEYYVDGADEFETLGATGYENSKAFSLSEDGEVFTIRPESKNGYMVTYDYSITIGKEGDALIDVSKTYTGSAARGVKRKYKYMTPKEREQDYEKEINGISENAEPVTKIMEVILDDTVTPEEELRKQLEQFFELLEDR